MSNENNQEEKKSAKGGSPSGGKKHGLGKILFKLITLGGLLLILFKYFKSENNKEESKEKQE